MGLSKGNISQNLSDYVSLAMTGRCFANDHIVSSIREHIEKIVQLQ